MRNLLYLVVFVFLIASCKSEENHSDEKGIYISGTVGFPDQNAQIILEQLSPTTAFPVDTIMLKEDYSFKHFFPISSPGYYRLNFYNKQYVVLILDDEDISVTVDGNSRTGFAEVGGSKDHDLIGDVKLMQEGFQQDELIQKLNQDFTVASQQGNQYRMVQLRDQYAKLWQNNNDSIASIIHNAPASLAKIELLRGGNLLNKDQYFDLYLETADQLSAKYPNHEVVNEFLDIVEKMKFLAPGNEAPEIELPNQAGELVALSSLRGKYVLVDFWAKWCKPCRQENPNIVRMYKQFHDKGFEVFGVSLDRNKQDWLQAIEEDELHWTQVSDLQFWNSAAAKTYNVTSIPFALLLDPDGKIIAKNLRGPSLEAKLNEIFN